MTLNKEMKVYSEEHPRSIGFVLDVTDKGAKIEWVTPPEVFPPFGCINLEWWPVADWHLLTVIGQAPQL